MKLTVINSNSSGNAYLIQNETSALLIECGVSYPQIKQAADFNIGKIDLCLISHEHRDHSKAVDQIISAGIPVACSNGTAKALNIDKFEALKENDLMNFGAWKIVPFKVDHDASEPMGFVIYHRDFGSLLFITDTYIVRHNFTASFDHVLIEANYCQQLADKCSHEFINQRRLRSHMSIQTAKETLSRMNLDRTKNITLIHLSDGLSNERDFIDEIESSFGIPTLCASPGLEFKL